MNIEFFTHDHPHRMSYYATHPSAPFLSTPAALQILAIASYGCGLRLARALKNSALGCVQLPFLGLWLYWYVKFLGTHVSLATLLAVFKD
jgi:hypothetical protein